MRIVIQRVTEAAVKVDKRITGEIGLGLLIFVGIEDADNDEDIEWISNKVVNIRIFNDDNGVMNKSLKDVDGQLLLVSQFTLLASTKKGNRPSYIKASKSEFAALMYEKVIGQLQLALGKKIQTGIFRAEMKVSLINDGPVTIIMDSKNKE